MAVLKTLDNSEMIISCKCGCDDGIRLKIEKDEEDYCFMTYVSGNWYKAVSYTHLDVYKRQHNACVQW